MNLAGEVGMNWLDQALNQRCLDARDWVRACLGAGLVGPASWMPVLREAGWDDAVALPARDIPGRHTDRPIPAVPPELLCHLEALAACSPGAATILSAHTAARLALHAGGGAGGSTVLGSELQGQWLSWPLFHDIDEQLWPAMNAQGHLQGQVDMLLPGTLARWAVLPAQGRDAALHLVLVDLRHPAVIRGPQIQTLGLPDVGLNDVEFGGVPCEVLALNGRKTFTEVSQRLATPVIAMLCGLSRASFDAASRQVCRLQASESGAKAEGAPLTQASRMWTDMRERLGVMQALLAHAGVRAVHATAADRLSADATQASAHLLQVAELATALCADGLRLLSMEAGRGSSQDAAVRSAEARAQAQRVCDAGQLTGVLGGVAWRRHGVIRGEGRG